MARRLHQKQTFLFGHRRGSYPARSWGELKAGGRVLRR